VCGGLGLWPVTYRTRNPELIRRKVCWLLYLPANGQGCMLWPAACRRAVELVHRALSERL